MSKTEPTKKQYDAAEADLKEIKRSDWKPIKGADTALYIEDRTELPSGSLYCVGKRGTVFVSCPDGRLIVCPNSVRMTSSNPHDEEAIRRAIALAESKPEGKA